MSEKARTPDSNTDWKAIDIFVFSNGQQYSPPRKYHIRSSDLDAWESTLKLVAKTQYSSMETSMVDLYTLEGRKLVGPLELSQGASYVAVVPKDVFLDAGYEKYLIKASRSWEKRQAKKADVVKLAEKTIAEIEHDHVKVKGPYNKPQDKNMNLKTIVSCGENQNSSVIVKPQATLAFRQKRNPAPTTTAKSRSPVQRPMTIRKITPDAPPTPNLKPSCKKKDSLIPTNVKITRPETNRYSSSASGSNQDSKPPVKNKTFISTVRARESSPCPKAFLPKAEKVIKPLKSSTKRISMDHKKVSTNTTELKDVIENKEIVSISNLYQNPDRDLPSITINPILSLHEPIKQQARTVVIGNNSDNIQEKLEIISSNTVHKSKNDTEIEKYVNLNEGNKSNRTENMTAENVVLESYVIHPITHKMEENTYSDNQVKTNTSKSMENISIHESPAQRHLVKANKLSNYQCESQNITQKSDVNLNNNLIVYASKSNETNKYNSLPPSHSVNIEKSHNLHINATEKPLSDKYMAVLNKGDVVNLKFNIEIENHDGSRITEHNDNSMEYRSAGDIHTEKGSQININDLIVAQNESLLSLIGPEDNYRVIVFQNSGCNNCDDKTNLEKKSNRNYMVIVPVEKVEEIMESCRCNQAQPDIGQIILQDPIKATHSCVYFENTTKPNLTVPQNLYTSDPKANETVVKDMSVPKKKSVAINEESNNINQDQSRLSVSSREINIKTHFLNVSMESVQIQSKLIRDESTQTEWCQVLLEARLLGDGHYTFHLPPLEMLKYYKLV